MFIEITATYLTIGCVVVLAGPGKLLIDKEVRGLRGSGISRAITGNPEVPEGKVLAFRVIMSIVMVFIWPLPAIIGVGDLVEQWRWRRRVARGLEFERMGGAGVIHCGECGFEEEITSFMHGATYGPDACCDTGLQCLSCGKFVSVHQTGNPPVEDIPPCECGGELSRDHVLFCPKCGSRNLSYRMTVIS